ncbi:MAG: type II toxin-antitoxin system RelE/ParE family toxin [Myxococcota bacterium]
MGYRVYEYVDAQGDKPWRQWLETLDTSVRARVQVCIWRVQEGNLGDHKAVGAGVWELRLHFGSGYRVYCGLQLDKGLVVLLVGGNKGSQQKDIRLARQLWQQWKREEKHG